MRTLQLTISALLLAFVSCGALADWVPPGFESLNEPQTTVVDVHYGGYFLHSTLARFNHDELTFIDPESLISRVADLADPNAALVLLQQALPLNTEHLCHSDFQLDCGSLTTDSIEIIFDRNNLRAWLFIGSALLTTQKSGSGRFLPASSGEMSLFSDNALYFSNAGSQSSFNLSNNTAIALAENRLLVRSNLTDSEGLTVDTLALSRESNGMALAVGLFRGETNNARFINSEHFVGASIQSSVLTRTDLEQVQGTNLTYFLDSRSRIEIFKDGRLYSTDYYEVGNQELNTSSLPSGSYDIEIRITDASGSTRTETRFYSKTALLPPSDQDIYFLQAGQLVDQQGDDTGLQKGDSFLRAGYSKRLTDSVGADVVVSLTEESTLVETGIFRQGRNYQVRTGLAFENSGAIGFDTDLRLIMNNLSFNLNARHIVSDNVATQLGESLTQISSSLELPTRVGPFSLFYRSNDRGESYSGKSYGLRWRSPNRKMGSGNLQTSVEVSRNNGNMFAALSVNYRFGGRDGSHSFSPRLAYEQPIDTDSTVELQGAVESRWQLAETGNRQLSLRADRYNQSAIEARFEAQGYRGATDVTARYNLDSKAPEFFGSVSTRFATTGTASALGGQRSAESALLVDIDGVSEDVEFEVLVNGSPRAIARAGKTQLLPVSPYETYDISLRPLGDDIINLDARSYRKTVYPGNVIAVSWQANNVAIVYGRVISDAGDPITDALLSNVIGLATTDNEGFFQAEINPETDHLVVQKQGQQCQAQLPAMSQDSKLIPLGTLTCSNQ